MCICTAEYWSMLRGKTLEQAHPLVDRGERRRQQATGYNGGGGLACVLLYSGGCTPQLHYVDL